MSVTKTKPEPAAIPDLRECAQAYAEADARVRELTRPLEVASADLTAARTKLREALKTVPGRQAVINGELFRLSPNGTLSVSKIEVLP